jgi:hypothetical protein
LVYIEDSILVRYELRTTNNTSRSTHHTNEKKDRWKDHGSWRQQMISYPLNIKRSEWENLDEEEQVKLRQDTMWIK